MLSERRCRAGTDRNAEAPGDYEAGYALSDGKRGKERKEAKGRRGGLTQETAEKIQTGRRVGWIAEYVSSQPFLRSVLYGFYNKKTEL